MPLIIAETELQENPDSVHLCKNLTFLWIYLNRLESESERGRERNLNKPSGSYGARHQVGASSRKVPEPGELKVQACIV